MAVSRDGPTGGTLQPERPSAQRPRLVEWGPMEFLPRRTFVLIAVPWFLVGMAPVDVWYYTVYPSWQMGPIEFLATQWPTILSRPFGYPVALAAYHSPLLDWSAHDYYCPDLGLAMMTGDAVNSLLWAALLTCALWFVARARRTGRS